MNDQLKENIELAKSSDSFLFGQRPDSSASPFHEPDSLGGGGIVGDIAVELPFIK